MKLRCPYWLLLPAVLILGIWVASRLASEPYPIKASAAVFGTSIWILLFLIFHGGNRGWRSVRVFIGLFMFATFGAILYRQLVHELAFYRLGLELMGAAVMSALFYATFWPDQAGRKRRPEAQPNAAPNGGPATQLGN
ncbi:MAG TPA: hypothetical protein PKE47_07620, partial [Verrucomicrobiota bacterium]|nr:hypothetical protein [Verrucomicrobiota bacterium]